MYRQIVQQVARAAHFPIARFGSDHFVLEARMITELREMSYVDRWMTSRTREWFHIEMEDLSIFSFSEGGQAKSYSYIQCPLDVPSFREYLEQLGLAFTTQNRRELTGDYELLLETADLKPHLTPIRYDLDPIGYRSGVHPLAHVHIGLDNNVRLGVRKKMTPLAFVFFVMRQAYPEAWFRLLQHMESKNVERKIRAECEDADKEMWLAHDQIEHYLA